MLEPLLSKHSFTRGFVAGAPRSNRFFARRGPAERFAHELLDRGIGLYRARVADPERLHGWQRLAAQAPEAAYELGIAAAYAGAELAARTAEGVGSVIAADIKHDVRTARLYLESPAARARLKDAAVNWRTTLQRKKREAIAIGLLAATALGASTYTARQPQAATGAHTEQEYSSFSLFKDDATKYADRIIENGAAIRDSEGKQEHLYNTIHAQLQQQYPAIVIPRLFGFMDDQREIGNIADLYRARDDVLSRAKKDGIQLPMEFIASAISNEGHSLDVDAPYANHTGGFGGYGLDTFGSEFKRIAALGYLPQDFRSEFSPSMHVNELGQSVTSANFNSKQAAFRAFVATLAHRQKLFLDDLADNGIDESDITPEERLFFTYKYYNGGPNSSEGLLRKGSASAIHQYFGNVQNVGSKGNSYVVLSGAQLLQQAGAMDPRPDGKYWWSK